MVAGDLLYPKVLLSIAVAFLMLANVPILGSDRGADSIRLAAGDSRTFIVGGVDFTNAIATLSPFKYTSVQEQMAIWPCMSTLLTYDTEGEIIGDIADSWTATPDGMTWCFRIQPGIYFTDPSNPSAKVHQLTWLDIQYSYFQAQNHSNSLQSFFKPFYGGPGAIARIWGSEEANYVNITLAQPFAPLLSALANVPIIPKYYWQPHENAQGDATVWTSALPVGSGPWYYGLPGLPTTGEVSLLRSPIWFQEANRGWQVHVNTLKYRSEMTAVQAWSDVKAGVIDLVMDVPASTFINDLPLEPSLTGWAIDTGYVYEYNLCQMTNTMRSQLGSTYSYGTNNQLLLDPTVKRAMAMAVDKQGFVDVILQGLGSAADSLVPEVNPWHFCPTNQVTFDIAGANTLLQNSGYVDADADGIREATASSPAVLHGLVAAGSELNFRFATLNSAVEWQQGATLIRDWAAQIGVKLNLVIVTYGQLAQCWMKADYDAWLWNWLFSPLGDPSTDIMSVLTTGAIGTWQDLYYSNKTYDSTFNKSLVEMEPILRKGYTDQLQQMAYDDMGCQLVAYRKSLYVANAAKWPQPSFEGCGSEWGRNPDSLLPWLYMQLSPADNPVPMISVQPSYAVNTGIPSDFVGSAIDGSSLEYQWFWGDGSLPTGWTSTAAAVHTYAEEGYYTAYFAAKEVGTADGFISCHAVRVSAMGGPDHAPHDLGISVNHASPYAGQMVEFTGTAVDDDVGDTLAFYWNFGDASTASGQVVLHAFSAPGDYSVRMSVSDGHVTVSTTKIVSARADTVPTIHVPNQFYSWKEMSLFYVNASDADGDPLRFTWFWGDGTVSITDSAIAAHAFQQKQVYVLTVYADDLTGIQGHNVSGSGILTMSGVNVPPVIHSFAASTLVAEVGEAIPFTASASDSNGGILRMTFQYTGTPTEYDVRTSDLLLAGQVFTATATHSYSSPGVKSVSLFVMDNIGNNVTTTPFTLTIMSPNGPPIVTPLTPVFGVAGNVITFTGDAFDPDNAVLRFTWDFGDGSPMKVGQSLAYAYSKPGTWTVTLFVDDLTGLPGHNVSASTTATIGWRLNLLSGWNLISIPMLTNYTAGTLGLARGDMVVNWSTRMQSYDKIFIQGISPPSMEFPILPSTGYLVFVSASRTLTLYGTVPTTQQSRVITLPATGGWALIGLCSMRTDLRAEDLRTMYSGGTITIVVTLSRPDFVPLYVTHIIGIPMMNNFLILPGSGYWIWATGSGVLSYNPNSGPIFYPNS